MAQKITAGLQDDLGGGPAGQTVRFGVDGAEYESDLSTNNAAAFRRKLAPFAIALPGSWRSGGPVSCRAGWAGQ